MIQPRSPPVHLIVQLLPSDHGKLFHSQASAGATIPYGNTWERKAMAQVAQQGVYGVCSSELPSGKTQSSCHIHVSSLQFSIGRSELILPPLLLLQVPVPGRAVAGRAAEQRAPLVTHGQLRPIKVRKETVEEGQPALKSATLPCGLHPDLTGRPIRREETVLFVGVVEELPIAKVLHHTWTTMGK